MISKPSDVRYEDSTDRETVTSLLESEQKVLNSIIVNRLVRLVDLLSPILYNWENNQDIKETLENNKLVNRIKNNIDLINVIDCELDKIICKLDI